MSIHFKYVKRAVLVSRIIMLIPTSISVGLTSVSLGIIRSIEQQGVRLKVFKPVTQTCIGDTRLAKNDAIIPNNSSVILSESLQISYVKSLLRANRQDVLMEELLALYHKNTKDAEVVLIEGLAPNSKHQFANSLNYEIAKTLNAEIVLVLVLSTVSSTQLKEMIELACISFGGSKNNSIIGVIINKLNAPLNQLNGTYLNFCEMPEDHIKYGITHAEAEHLFSDLPLPVLGCVPWNFDLIAMRAIDIARHLNARVINNGDIMTRRITCVAFCACSMPHMLDQFRAGAMLVISSDRLDILVSACLSAMNGIEIGAILLTGGYIIHDSIKMLCNNAFQTGLPVFIVDTNIWETSLNLQSVTLEVPSDDYQRIDKVQNYISSHINTAWVESLSATPKCYPRMSPPAFRYELTKLAREAGKRIILPEGDEPRTVKAATICAERGIAKCVLLGNPKEIKRVAIAQDIELSADIEVVDPVHVRAKYILRLLELRKSKGMNELIARQQLKDNVVLATLMLEMGEVDGLVSGVVHTTANTIRPALQLIKTAPGASLVSSIFFMLLPDQVLVYGDCAINPDPNAEQLSEIAIQSADSAAAFGIEPCVAMLSYSTGNSGAGIEVDKVREATRLAKQKRPDLIIDGPLQYDAAIMADVAKLKAPYSPVAGHATVFIFPDLNTGNTTYKAVQRSAGLVSIGPMLQGMCKPVNDLSRGALVDDIVYTIALTAIQAFQRK